MGLRSGGDQSIACLAEAERGPRRLPLIKIFCKTRRGTEGVVAYSVYEASVLYIGALGIFLCRKRVIVLAF